MARKVCLGGTFNVIHNGHLALLGRAFESGDEVYIGLTSDEFASGSRNIPVLDYETRFLNLNRALEGISGGKHFSIFPLDDPMGPAAWEDYDVIVVSRDTVKGAENINAARRKNGLKPLEIIVIDMVLAHDGKPISSSRVLEGHIGSSGNAIQ